MLKNKLKPLAFIEKICYTIIKSNIMKIMKAAFIALNVMQLFTA